MSEDFKIGCGITLIVLVTVAIFVGCIFMDLGNKQNFDAIVTTTQIDEGNTFFVLTRPDGSSSVYENEDSWAYGKFNSSDYLMGLEVGKSYHFFTVGFRVPFFSAYPNIIRYTPIQ